MDANGRYKPRLLLAIDFRVSHGLQLTWACEILARDTAEVRGDFTQEDYQVGMYTDPKTNEVRIVVLAAYAPEKPHGLPRPSWLA